MWSMPANDVRTFVNGLGSLGYDRGALLASAGLGDPELNDPDARIPCESLGTILSCAQRMRFTPNLALELAQVTPIGTAALASSRSTPSNHQCGSSPVISGSWAIPSSSTCAMRTMTSVLRWQRSGPVQPEYVASLIVLHLRDETDGRFAVTSIDFQHTPDDVVGIRAPPAGASFGRRHRGTG
jgi:hypothetical protein